MKSREEYINKLAAQFKGWCYDIHELETKARAGKADVKTGYESQIRQLKDKRDAAMLILLDLKGASSKAWGTLKAGAETAWADLRDSVAAAKESFKKPSGPSGKGN